MKHLKSLVLILTLITPTLSMAETNPSPYTPWCHIHLRSTDGTRIQFDYSKFVSLAGRFGTYWTAQPWIQVSGPTIYGNERVRAVLFARNAVYNPPAQIFDLGYDASQGHFTGQAPQLQILQNGPTAPGNPRATVSLAVVVNGDWKKDPISGSSDFEINLDQRPGECDK